MGDSESCEHEVDLRSLVIADDAPIEIDGCDTLSFVVDGTCKHCGRSCGMLAVVNLDEVDW